MSLIQMTAHLFDRNVRTRGQDIFAAGRVRLQNWGNVSVIARVRGGDFYDVRIRKQHDGLEVSCECIAFEEYGPCKHVWATLLEADRRRALADVTRVLFLKKESEDGEEGDPFPVVSRLPQVVAAPPVPAWQEYLGDVERALKSEKPANDTPAKPMQILYCIDVQGSKSSGKLRIGFYSRTQKRDGTWSQPKPLQFSSRELERLPDAVDTEILSSLLGGHETYLYSYVSPTRDLILPLARKLLPVMAATGRLCWRDYTLDRFEPLVWDEREPWVFRLEIRQDERDQWAITGVLRRGEERMDLEEPLLLVNGLLIARGAVSRLESRGSFGWLSELRKVKRIPFPDRERDAVLGKLLNLPALPPMDVDEGLKFEERTGAPRLGLRIREERGGMLPRHVAQYMVDYGAGWMDGMSEGRGMWHPADRVYILRDAAAEAAGRARLMDLGMRTDTYRRDLWMIGAKSLPRIARELIAAGWHVEAEGKLFRKPGSARVSVKSGIDWFELHGEVEYGDTTASLPDLLAAVRRGDSVVVLGDGTFGLLPEEWLERFGTLAGMGEKSDGHLKFRQNQAALLDALLAAQPDVDFDEAFSRVRERIRTFHGVESAPQPEGFRGQLRQYQLEGLGWMHFLREFGFGGCLADDMGVGKTAQVLAILEERRAGGQGPSLVVVPKSVMFNWREEAARFTPNLRVLEYHGTLRDAKKIPRHDLVLTTYGTTLRDAEALSKIDFDYVVLDEAQAVKNASTASAKAVRLLRGKHRLALSGTPVENHLGELWSLFEFLNPGMLGEAKVLRISGGMARNPSPEARQLLGHALRPFILRRTKQQVARELPEKTEQTIFCELEGAQRKHYEEMRRHYRNSLLERSRSEGLGQWKMHVLEALLRLRQAACHPGLLDSARVEESSAKLDVLMEQLAEIRDGGHKALVFSQFTSLLAIVRRKLDQQGIRYEYLDGATTNRQSHVETFQNDPDCGLFLISLKAGGLGLNLTAAEYVFLLDPWWNPAVEAQAVDRAHRIGQTKPVFAYRLIARDTVEEKVLQLQKTKRDLADAILSEDNSLIRDLKKEDLDLLLS